VLGEDSKKSPAPHWGWLEMSLLQGIQEEAKKELTTDRDTENTEKDKSREF